VGVTEVLQRDHGQTCGLNVRLEHPRERPRPERRSVLVAEDKVPIVVGRAQSEPLLRLPLAVGAEGGNGHGVKVDLAPASIRLRR
jgi:hypothetical protein